MMKKGDSRLVYSCEQGKMCPKCQKPIKQCCCKKMTAPVAKDTIVRVSRETKGRKGKGVTVVTGIPLVEAELKLYAQKLKKKCGSGGTLKQGVVEIQGDHRDLLLSLLAAEGWVVKKAGG
ncbi:MAG: translation initiation factor [Desulfobacteraceae bacterium 4572_35.2]|nr:MAG: translation initiation factor [Desulfobacteraceae bacterium 4572_35.2]